MKKLNWFQKIGFICLSWIFFSGTAFAETYYLNGYYDRSYPNSLYKYDGDITPHLIVAGDFEHEFIFTVPDGNIWNFSASVGSTEDSMGVFTELSFQGQQGTLEMYSAYIGARSQFPTGGSTVHWSTDREETEILIHPGTYSVLVSGTSDYSHQSYSINAQLNAVSAIPEPSSIALMLAGLGLTGFMAARRRHQIQT